MRLFRVFDWDGTALGRSQGGPLFVPRVRQGSGRHDNPSHYGAWYCSRDPESAIAEAIQPFRGQTLDDGDLVRPDGRRKALVGLDVDDDIALVDLDDPRQLSLRTLRPSQVATLRRPVTQQIAVSIFHEGAAGLSWWSTLEAEWTNVTLFYERAIPVVRIAAPPRPLLTRDAHVRAAAARLDIAV